MSIFIIVVLLLAWHSLHESVLLNKLSRGGEKVRPLPSLWPVAGEGPLMTQAVVQVKQVLHITTFPEVSSSELFSSPSKGF